MVTLFDEKPNELRLRGPRVFYGVDKIYKEIIIFHTEILNVLQVFKKGKYSHSSFYDAIAFQLTNNDEKHRQVLVLLLEALILLSEKKMKHIWIIPMQNLQQIELKPEGVKVSTNSDIKNFDKISPR